MNNADWINKINVIFSHCLCKDFSVSNIKYEEGEEGKVKRETDEEEMMIMGFGNNKNNKDDEK